MNINKYERCTNSYVQLEKLLLREASSALLSSEKHDRNEKLLVNCPGLRKRQRSQAAVSPS